MPTSLPRQCRGWPGLHRPPQPTFRIPPPPCRRHRDTAAGCRPMVVTLTWAPSADHSVTSLSCHDAMPPRREHPPPRQQQQLLRPHPHAPFCRGKVPYHHRHHNIHPSAHHHHHRRQHSVASIEDVMLLHRVRELEGLTRPTNLSTELKIYLDICTGSQMNYNFSRNILICREFF